MWWPRWTYLTFVLLLCNAAAQVTTTVVETTSTKTVHVTATDYAGACDNFVGACVVYGTHGAAPYTTTVYRYAPTSTSATLVTSTTTLVATTTASDSGACESFVGACVVYATNEDGAATRSVYYAGSSATARPGNDQGYIGPKQDDGGDGVIGRGAAGTVQSSMNTVLGFVLLLPVFIL